MMADDDEEIYVGPLYKYHGIRGCRKQYLENLFLKSEIYFSQPSKLNDPFECRALLDFSGSRKEIQTFLEPGYENQYPHLNRKNIIEMAKTKAIELEGIALDQEMYFKGAADRIGIFSMSEKSDDILMWSHYAEDHEGVCLEFEANIKNNYFIPAFKVDYPPNNEIPVVKLLDISSDETFPLKKLFLTKSNQWEYEVERRLISESKPKRPGWGIQTFPGELLTRIILGCETEPETIDFLKATLKKRRRTKIKVSQAKKKERHYGLDIIDITEEFYS